MKRITDYMNYTLKNRGTHYDSFANHFVKKTIERNDTIRTKDTHNTIKIRIIKEMSLRLVSKKFGSHKCQHCMEERTQISKAKLFKSSDNTSENIKYSGPTGIGLKHTTMRKQECHTGLKMCVCVKKGIK